MEGIPTAISIATSLLAAFSGAYLMSKWVKPRKYVMSADDGYWRDTKEDPIPSELYHSYIPRYLNQPLLVSDGFRVAVMQSINYDENGEIIMSDLGAKTVKFWRPLPEAPRK